MILPHCAGKQRTMGVCPLSGGLFSAGTRKIGCARTHDRGSTGRNCVHPQPWEKCLHLSQPGGICAKLADREEIQSYRMKQFQQSGQDCYLLMQLKQDADPALRFASMRYLEKQNIAPAIEITRFSTVAIFRPESAAFLNRNCWSSCIRNSTVLSPWIITATACLSAMLSC